ncbi:mechanosensitive ion channel family protein [Anaerolineales bacterium HSG24]|nr:mechanosensitive ion channel family protein [Anaerolineales bacterium HSG24]
MDNFVVVYGQFNVDDFVEVADGVKGTVREINEYHTVLVTADKQTIVLPNRLIVSNKIINYGLEPTRRLDLIYGIGYESDLLQAKHILQDIVSELEFVLDEPKPLIGVQELADSSINFLVRIHLKGEHAGIAPLMINEQVKLRFDAADISIP